MNISEKLFANLKYMLTGTFENTSAAPITAEKADQAKEALIQKEERARERALRAEERRIQRLEAREKCEELHPVVSKTLEIATAVAVVYLADKGAKVLAEQVEKIPELLTIPTTEDLLGAFECRIKPSTFSRSQNPKVADKYNEKKPQRESQVSENPPSITSKPSDSQISDNPPSVTSKTPDSKISDNPPSTKFEPAPEKPPVAISEPKPLSEDEILALTVALGVIPLGVALYGIAKTPKSQPLPTPVLQQSPVVQALQSPVLQPAPVVQAPQSPVLQPAPVVQAPKSPDPQPAPVVQAPQIPVPQPLPVVQAPQSPVPQPLPVVQAPPVPQLQQQPPVVQLPGPPVPPPLPQQPAIQAPIGVAPLNPAILQAKILQKQKIKKAENYIEKMKSKLTNIKREKKHSLVTQIKAHEERLEGLKRQKIG